MFDDFDLIELEARILDSSFPQKHVFQMCFLFQLTVRRLEAHEVWYPMSFGKLVEQTSGQPAVMCFVGDVHLGIYIIDFLSRLTLLLFWFVHDFHVVFS